MEEIKKKERKPNGYWNDIENIKKHAKEYNTKSEFRKSCSTGYREAVQRGIINELFESLHKPDNYWTEETVRIHAKECNTKTDFREKYSSGYSLALELGIINELFKDQSGKSRKDIIKTSERKPSGYWTEETVRLHAKECISKHDFQKKYNTGYKLARKLEIINELFEDIVKPKGFWDIKHNIIEYANKCISKNDFRLKYGTAYYKAIEFNMIDDLFENLRKPDGYWTEDNVRKHSKECISRIDFEEKYFSGYLTALELGIMDDLYPIKNDRNQFKLKPHCVYKYTLKNKNNDKLVYIGITCHTKTRKNDHSSNTVAYSAVGEELKKGSEIMEYEILYENIPWKEADTIETDLIEKYLLDKNVICLNRHFKGIISKLKKEN